MPDLEERIAAARAYESLHVPALFGEWPPHVLDAAGVAHGQRVLDVACGTGVLGRAARRRVGPEAFVAGVDLDHGMVAVAGQIEPDVEWRQGPAESLPYPDRAFDAVVSQFGMMFFADRERALEEMRRVVAPGGTVTVAVWDALERTAAYADSVALLERMAGPAAADALRAPFALGNADALSDLFCASGFEGVSVTTRVGTARFPDVRTMVEADLRGWLPVMGVVLEDETIEAVLDAAEDVLRRYVTADGRVEFGAPAHVVTGRKR